MIPVTTKSPQWRIHLQDGLDEEEEREGREASEWVRAGGQPWKDGLWLVSVWVLEGGTDSREQCPGPGLGQELQLPGVLLRS